MTPATCGVWSVGISRSASDIMLFLHADGCHNINCVSPSHVIPQILAAVEIALDYGMTI